MKVRVWEVGVRGDEGVRVWKGESVWGVRVWGER